MELLDNFVRLQYSVMSAMFIEGQDTKILRQHLMEAPKLVSQTRLPGELTFKRSPEGCEPQEGRRAFLTAGTKAPRKHGSVQELEETPCDGSGILLGGGEETGGKPDDRVEFRAS